MLDTIFSAPSLVSKNAVLVAKNAVPYRENDRSEQVWFRTTSHFTTILLWYRKGGEASPSLQGSRYSSTGCAELKSSVDGRLRAPWPPG